MRGNSHRADESAHGEIDLRREGQGGGTELDSPVTTEGEGGTDGWTGGGDGKER